MSDHLYLSGNHTVYGYYSEITFKVITTGTDLSGDDTLNDILSGLEFDDDSSSNRLIRDTSFSARNIEKIDVKCDQGNGMLVEVQFSENFEGVIYSQGYYNDPKCKYVIKKDFIH